MSRTHATTGEPRESRLRWLIISQVGLVAIATIIFAYIGWRLQPLLQQQKDLQAKNAGLNQQISDKQEVLRALNDAITRSKNDSLVREAGQIELLPLRGYKVGIHYLQDNTGAAARANDLMSALNAAHSPATIAVYARPTSFFTYYSYNHPTDDQVRYEPDYETAQAQALMTLLRTVDPTHTYTLRPVQNRTPNFISIFLHDGL